MGWGDDNVGLDVPNNNETNSGNGNDDVLDENRNNEGGKDVGNDANVVGKSSDGDNGDGDNSNGIFISNGGNDSNDVSNPPVSGDAVGERKKKVKSGQQSKGWGDDRVGLDRPIHDEINSGDDNDGDLDENRKNEAGKMFAMMATMLASLVMVTTVMVTTVMALLTILVAMTAMMLLTLLTVVMLLVKIWSKVFLQYRPTCEYLC